jgi:hypothetical protein
MLARLILKLALGVTGVVIAITTIAMGVCFLGEGLANALIASQGPVYGYLVAGAILLLPFLIAMLGIVVKLRRAQARVSPPVTHTIARSLFSAVARGAPWVAASGAAAVAAAEVFLNRKKPRT